VLLLKLLFLEPPHLALSSNKQVDLGIGRLLGGDRECRLEYLLPCLTRPERLAELDSS